MFVNISFAKTLGDFIDERYTKKDMEKCFIEVSRTYLTIQIPKNLESNCHSSIDCAQMYWKDYCAGAILHNLVTNKMIVTLDRCGYPNGQNRKYPPTENDINSFLGVFTNIDEVLPKDPGLLKRKDYLPESLE